MSDWNRPTLLEDDEPRDVPKEYRTVTTSTGEVVELHPDVAKLRMVHKLAYAERRVAYCEKHNRDPLIFRGCVDCGGTGKAYSNDLACHCEQGKRVLQWDKRADDANTARLLEKLKDKTWLTDETRDRHRGKTGEA
jgi:hypothetical protein